MANLNFGTNATRWGTPLLAGSLASRAGQAVEDIANALLEVDPSRLLDCSLATGAAGLAVFHSTFARYSGNSNHVRRAESLMDRCLELAESRPLQPSLFGGFSGIAWTFEVFGGASPDFNDAIDEALLEATAPEQCLLGYDLVNGLAGVGLFAFTRRAQTTGTRLLQQVVDRLIESAVATHPGLSWEWDLHWTPEAFRTGREAGERDVGVAHGAAGVLPVLASAAAILADHASARAYAQTRDWLLSTRLSNSAAVFPARVGAHAPGEPTRSAWCYGDPGVAASLAAAATLADDRSLLALAREIALRSLDRPLAEWRVHDAGLCHGSAGLAHIFHRLFRTMGDGRFRNAALSLLTLTLERQRPGSGVGGFRAYDGASVPPRWVDDAGFLEGAAGVGLSLLAALDHGAPLWDSALGIGLEL